MRDYYQGGMPGLKKSFYILLSLLRKCMPKLFQHFLDENYTPA